MDKELSSKEPWASSLPEEDKYRFINKKCVDTVIPEVLRRVLHWGCSKHPSQSFTEYIESKHKCKCSKLFRYYQRELEKSIADSYDTCVIYDIIPYACDGIAKTGSVEWVKAKEDPRNIEYHLYKVKSLRNLVVHYPETEGVSRVFASDIQAPIENLIAVAALKFNRTNEEAKEFIDKITEDIRGIKEGVMSSKEREITAVLRALRTDGKKEVKEYSEAVLSEEFLPYSKFKVSLNDVFHRPTLIHEDTQEEIGCAELFTEKFENKFHCILIQGAAGSGKTTLLKRIALDYLDIPSQKGIFKDVKLFSTILGIVCRKSEVATAAQLLKEHFPKALKPFTNLSQDAVEAIFNTKALILIDGVDDLTSTSRDLIKEVLHIFTGSLGSRLVVTTRPSMTNEFVHELEKRDVSYQSFTLKEISQEHEQIKFLQRYGDAIPGIETSRLIDAFRSVKSARGYFIYPVYLSLFCHLFTNKKEVITGLTSPEKLMEETLRIGEEKAIERVSKYVSVNSEIVTNLICEKIYDLSLKCLHLGEHRIDPETYKEFCRVCFSEISEIVPYKSVLSCLMTAKKSKNSPKEVYFEWFHKTFAEYLASKSLTVNILRSKKSVKILDILSEITGMEVCEDDLQRYQNVILFCILYFNTDSRKRQLRGSLPQLLNLLKNTTTSAKDWTRIVHLWPESETVASIAAEAAAMSFSEWKVQDSNECHAVSRMLPHQQPLILKLAMPKFLDPLPCLLANVGKYFKGTLKLDFHKSYASYTPCDDVLLHNLRNPRFGLVQFRGCVGAREGAAETLGAAVDEAGGLPWTMQGWVPELHISLGQPDAHHLLKYLNYRNHTLDIKIMHPEVALKPRPLPKSSLRPPALTVEGTPPGGGAILFSAISSLAPDDKWYSSVHLARCGLSQEDLQTLVSSLQVAGLRAGQTGTRHRGVRTFGARCDECGNSGNGGNTGCVSLHV